MFDHLDDDGDSILLTKVQMLRDNTTTSYGNFMSFDGWHHLVMGIAGLGLVFMSGLYLLHIVALVYGRFRLHKYPKNLGGLRENLPGVSIIKPLLGTDENLFFNLESFFNLAYPKFELLFCVSHSEEPASKVVALLQKKYPSVSSRIFVANETGVLNPKINNMMPAYRAGRYPLVLISDSRIYMHKEALEDMVLCLTESLKYGLVTQVPYCLDRSGFGANLEQVYFGGAHARIYLASHAMGFICSTGMSSLFYRSILDEDGGLEKYGSYLAEDYFIGRAVYNSGRRNVISHFPALQNSINTDAGVFTERICRWIKMRIAMLPHTIVLEPIQECVFSSFIGSFVVAYIFGWFPYVPQFLLFHYAFWCTCDYLLLSTMQNGPLPFSLLQFLFCWIFREFMTIPIFVKALLNPNITWRSGMYRLRWGGSIRTSLDSNHLTNQTLRMK